MRPYAFIAILLLASGLAVTACSNGTDEGAGQRDGKIIVYQVFTRLFGNKTDTNKPWGTLAENGAGKFGDFTDKALEGIKELGVSHIWYTGVLHHAVITDYSAYGISNDDPDVVKGRAGSPYAVKDYYSVDPDLATDPANRMAEFKALIDRTHAHGLKVIIDIIPNHVARGYRSLGKPEGVRDFGADDDTSVVYARDNNFYYVPGEDFRVPETPAGYAPLGGENHPLADGLFRESPAKWTGNGARAAQPKFDDWYETVKVNYGVRPDGSYDFPTLPEGFEEKDYRTHAAFWADRNVPDSWKKFRDIVFFWLDFGVDGFRYDMAEMVPVEFWSYLNSAIKMKRPDAFLLAEVYQPGLYRGYIHKGKMDYLYDKVDLYDTLKAIIQGRASTDILPTLQAKVMDVERHMLHFLENHDEQRIASPAFAGDPRKALPAMVVSATLGSSPTLLYFGQDVGEEGAGDAGFGDPTRTTIFDYWSVPAHQRWMNGGRFDGGALTDAEKKLRAYYRRLMSFTASSRALMGQYAEIHNHNRQVTTGYDGKLFSFARWNGEERLLIATNFDAGKTYRVSLAVPADVIAAWALPDSTYPAHDQLAGQRATLAVKNRHGKIDLELAPLQSLILKIQ